MKKNVWQAPLALCALLALSGGALTGVHFAMQAYETAHPTSNTPEEIQSLKDGGNFVEVADFVSYSKVGDSYAKPGDVGETITIVSIYNLMEDGQTAGIAYKINCGKAKNSDVIFTVLFEGQADAAKLEDIKPSAIYFVNASDDGYDTHVRAYAEGILNGSMEYEDAADIVTGASNSQNLLRDGLLLAREDYASRINGGGAPTDNTPDYIKNMYEDVRKYEEVSDFEPIASAKGTYTVDKWTRVSLMDGNEVFLYHISAPGQSGTMSFYVSFAMTAIERKESEVKPAKFLLADDNTEPEGVWNQTYLPSVMESGASDLEASASDADSKNVRLGLRAARDHYCKTTIAERKANVAASFKAIYPSTYVSYVQDEFAGISASNISIGGNATDLGSYNADARYSITLSEGTAKIYHISITSVFPEETGGVTADFFVGYSGTGATAEDIKTDGFVRVNSAMHDEWETVYLPGIVDGSKTLEDDNAVITNATYSSKTVREALKAVRLDYFGTLSK